MDRLSLPCEVLTDIFGRLSVTNLQQVRLVCRAFAAASEPHLFPRVYISPSLKDIEVFQYITNHRVFSKYINEIVCDDTILPARFLEQPNWDDWWNASQKRRDSRRTELDCSKTSQDQYMIYQKLHAERQRVKDHGTDMIALCSSLPNLPNLRSIVITDRTRNWSRSWLTSTSEACRDRDLPENASWSAEVLRGDVWDQRTSPHHGFVNMIRVLSISGTVISQLSIQGARGGISHRLFSQLQQQDYNHLCTVFSHLQKLELHINTHDRERIWHDASRSGKLVRVFAAAKSLEHLKLSFDMGNRLKLYLHGPSLDIESFFGNTTLLQLRALELESFEANPSSLAEFLARRHALENLTLTCFFYHACEYARFLDDLRRRAVVLKHCMFRVPNHIADEWSSGRPESEAFVKYLRHGGRNPCQTD